MCKCFACVKIRAHIVLFNDKLLKEKNVKGFVRDLFVKGTAFIKSLLTSAQELSMREEEEVV